MTDQTSRRITSLVDYSLLGRSGLRVSPLCLGAMTFGTESGWGAERDVSRAIFQRYLEAGGNFVDTANFYTNGHSEEMVGDFIKEAGVRDRVVLATKFTFNLNMTGGDPNFGGNGRKTIYQSLEASLRRLKTDYVDLYWMHTWDTLTPVEEVMETMDALVRQGKVRYFGLSDTPAWYLARAQTLAELRGLPRVVALQLEYSLIERNIEREHIPAALELGMGVCPWSPLGMGLLTGKYRRAEGTVGAGDGRLTDAQHGPNPILHKFNERNWRIADALVGVAKEIGRPAAQVALNWITRRPGVTSTIIGATKLGQLEENLAALEFDIPPALGQRLEELSRPETVFPYNFYAPALQSMLTAGGASVRKEPRWFRG
jgi:aryl-alcohol dehydrogenase-like predicted oxidoreductase